MNYLYFKRTRVVMTRGEAVRHFGVEYHTFGAAPCAVHVFADTAWLAERDDGTFWTIDGIHEHTAGNLSGAEGIAFSIYATLTGDVDDA